jgi:hypothetical protein
MASSSALEPVSAAPHGAGRPAPHACDRDCEEAGARWGAVDAALSGVIGRRGAAAVLRRALFMTRGTHRWMPVPSPDTGFDACLDAFTRALAEQRREDCGAGRRALEASFHDLLATLVGMELTGQLLQASRCAQPALRTPVP